MKEIFLRLNEASIIDDGFRQFPSIARPAVDHIIPYFLYIFQKGKLSSKSGHLERVAEILIGLRLRHRSIFPFFFSLHSSDSSLSLTGQKVFPH